MDKWNDDSYQHYMRGLSQKEREAIQALFHGTPEETLLRIQRRELPAGLTRVALDAYNRIASAAIRSDPKGETSNKLITVFGRTVGVQTFRQELIGKAYIICTE